MCGIHGLFWRDESAIRKMILASHNRGPDANDIFLDDVISLGHNLLSIMDTPDNSKQPWIVNGGSHILCYNGEIYNYRELRTALEAKGHLFKTDSDTEVLALGLFDQGIDFLKKLNGMYALSWYDKDKRTVTLARDLIGAKPLYYTTLNGKIAFSSTVKSLLSLDVDRVIDNFSFRLFHTFGYIPGPKTHFKNITKLIPGEIIKFNVDGNNIISKEILRSTPQSPTIFKAEDLRQAISESTKESLITQRTTGLYLSGGMDSLIILDALNKHSQNIQTITARYSINDPLFHEDANIAEKMSRQYGTSHSEILITEEDYVNALADGIAASQEPFRGASVAPRYILNKEASRRNLVVMFSGSGGDEHLYGYPRHRTLFNNLNPGNPISEWIKLTQRDFPENIRHDALTNDEIRDYIISWIPINEIPTDKMEGHLFLGWNTHLPEEYLIREDMIGSHFSIEARFPILSAPFRNYVNSIATYEKINQQDVSKLLVKSAYSTIFPKDVINKPKTPFPAPVLRWINISRKSQLREYINDVFSPEYHPESNPLFGLDKSKEMVYSQDHNTVRKIFTSFHYRIWAKEFNINVEM